MPKGGSEWPSLQREPSEKPSKTPRISHAFPFRHHVIDPFFGALDVGEAPRHAHAALEAQQVVEGLQAATVELGVPRVHDAVEEGDAKLDAVLGALPHADELSQLPQRPSGVVSY